MSSQQQQFREFARNERWNALRSWCFALGLVALAFAVGASGLGSVGNPKSASSIYSAFAAGGLLQWLVKPLIYFGIAALVTSAAIKFFLSRGRSGN